MNKGITYPILALVALFATLSAHSQENRQAAYTESIDFIKCKCAEIIYGINLNCDRDPATSRVEQYAARHPRTGTLMGELERMKQTDVASWPTDSISQFLSTTIFQNENRNTYPQSYNFSVNRGRNTDGTMDTLSAAIISHVRNRLPNLPTAEDLAILQDTVVDATLPPAIIPDDGYTVDDDYPTNTQPTGHPFFSFHFNIAHVILAALAILVSWLLINRIRREHEDKINDLKFRIDGKAEAGELMKVENELAGFTSKLEAARRKRLSEKQTKKPNAAPSTGVRPLSVEQVLYMPAPQADGTFQATGATVKFQPSVSVYKFKIDPSNPDLATFSFNADNLGLQHAIGNPETYIQPVCRETNAIHSGVKYVATVKSGVAVRKGDRWMVTDDQKAAIRYE